MTSLRTGLEQKLGWIILALVLCGCLLILLPFASALLWAIILTFSTWPLYRRLVHWFGGRRTLAALLMTLAMFCVILLPFFIVGMTLSDNVHDVTTAARGWMDAGPPGPPAWLVGLPGVGTKAGEYWNELAADSSKLLAATRQFIEPVTGWLLIGGLALGHGLIELALSILIAFFLFRDGEAAAKRLITAVERVAGQQGTHMVEVAGGTVRGVVYGILGTAFVQAIMAGDGLSRRGRPRRGLPRAAHVLSLGRAGRSPVDLAAGGAVALPPGREPDGGSSC